MWCFSHPVIHRLLQLVKNHRVGLKHLLFFSIINSVIYKIHSDVVRTSFTVDKLLGIIR